MEQEKLYGPSTHNGTLKKRTTFREYKGDYLIVEEYTGEFQPLMHVELQPDKETGTLRLPKIHLKSRCPFELKSDSSDFPIDLVNQSPAAGKHDDEYLGNNAHEEENISTTRTHGNRSMVASGIISGVGSQTTLLRPSKFNTSGYRITAAKPHNRIKAKSVSAPVLVPVALTEEQSPEDEPSVFGKEGYCENCRDRFSNYKEHIQSARHLQWVEGLKTSAALNDLRFMKRPERKRTSHDTIAAIATGMGTSDFLRETVAGYENIYTNQTWAKALGLILSVMQQNPADFEDQDMGLGEIAHVISGHMARVYGKYYDHEVKEAEDGSIVDEDGSLVNGQETMDECSSSKESSQVVESQKEEDKSEEKTANAAVEPTDVDEDDDDYVPTERNDNFTSDEGNNQEFFAVEGGAEMVQGKEEGPLGEQEAEHGENSSADPLTMDVELPVVDGHGACSSTTKPTNSATGLVLGNNSDKSLSYWKNRTNTASQSMVTHENVSPSPQRAAVNESLGNGHVLFPWTNGAAAPAQQPVVSENQRDNDPIVGIEAQEDILMESVICLDTSAEQVAEVQKERLQALDDKQVEVQQNDREEEKKEEELREEDKQEEESREEERQLENKASVGQSLRKEASDACYSGKELVQEENAAVQMEEESIDLSKKEIKGGEEKEEPGTSPPRSLFGTPLVIENDNPLFDDDFLSSMICKSGLEDFVRSASLCDPVPAGLEDTEDKEAVGDAIDKEEVSRDGNGTGKGDAERNDIIIVKEPVSKEEIEDPAYGQDEMDQEMAQEKLTIAETTAKEIPESLVEEDKIPERGGTDPMPSLSHRLREKTPRKTGLLNSRKRSSLKESCKEDDDELEVAHDNGTPNSTPSKKRPTPRVIGSTPNQQRSTRAASLVASRALKQLGEKELKEDEIERQEKRGYVLWASKEKKRILSIDEDPLASYSSPIKPEEPVKENLLSSAPEEGRMTLRLRLQRKKKNTAPVGKPVKKVQTISRKEENQENDNTPVLERIKIEAPLPDPSPLPRIRMRLSQPIADNPDLFAKSPFAFEQLCKMNVPSKRSSLDVQSSQSQKKHRGPTKEMQLPEKP